MNATEREKGHCPRCQAVNYGKSFMEGVTCWKCGALLKTRRSAVEIEKEAEFELDSKPTINGTVEADPSSKAVVVPRSGKYSYTIASLLLLMTVIAVLLGVSMVAPGLGITLAILGIPPIVRTALLTQKAQSLGQTFSAQQKTGYFLASLGVSAVIYFSASFLFVVAIVAALFFACFAGMPLYELAGEAGGYIAGGLAILFTLAFLIWLGRLYFLWIRRRWRRDVEHVTGKTTQGKQP